jgi:5-oxoprolinase (ATP-hydrolysing) subunit C
VIRVLAVAGLATVQDAGRPGRMHEGVPPGGALVPELLTMANAAAENAAGEAGIEVFGAITLTSDGPLLVAADGEAGRWLRAGEPWRVATAGARVRCIAVRGGVDVPAVLGGRGTLLAAAFGGHEGRPLRRGDALPVGEGPRRPPGGEVTAPLDPRAPIHLVPGPDVERFAPEALDLLLSSPFEIAPQSDRVGLRLRGAALPRTVDDAAVSGPMVRGAIQVPAGGEPIVLGPDHPTTGGYPVVATVIRADVGRVMARPLGATVRFSLERHGDGPGGIHAWWGLSPPKKRRNSR